MHKPSLYSPSPPPVASSTTAGRRGARGTRGGSLSLPLLSSITSRGTLNGSLPGCLSPKGDASSLSLLADVRRSLLPVLPPLALGVSRRAGSDPDSPATGAAPDLRAKQPSPCQVYVATPRRLTNYSSTPSRELPTALGLHSNHRTPLLCIKLLPVYLDTGHRQTPARHRNAQSRPGLRVLHLLTVTVNDDGVITATTPVRQ